MKSKILNIIVLSAISLLFSTCDKLEGPYIENPGNDTTGQTVKKVLVEDFTGHLCPNCPQAHKILHDLEQLYGTKVIGISIHAGFQSMPMPPTFTYDFRTATGNTLNSTFGITAYPSGLVNRTKYDGSLILDKDKWAEAVDTLLKSPAGFSIKLSHSYNSSTRKLNLNVESQALIDLTGVYRLCVYLVEDSIIKPQKNNDASLGATPEILNYCHMHVLRDAVNSTWGDTLISGNVSKGLKVNKSYSNYSLNTNWEDKHCYIVAFIYRDDDADQTRYQVMQAEEKKIR